MQVCLVVVGNLTHTVHAHEGLGLVIYFETVVLQADALSCHERPPLVSLQLLKVLVDLEHIGVNVSIKGESVSIVLEHCGESLNLVGQAYVNFLYWVLGKLVHVLFELLIGFVLHARRNFDEDPLELDPIDDFDIVFDSICPDPLDRREVWAGLNHTGEEAGQEGVFADVLVIVGQLESSQVSLQVCKLLDGAHQWDHSSSLFKFGIIPVLLEVKVDLVPSLVLFSECLPSKHSTLIVNKPFLVNEGDQAGSLPGECAAIQVDVEVLREEGTEFLAACDAPIAWREETYTLKWHDGEQLLEGCVRYVQLRTIVVYLEAIDGHFTLQEELHDVFVYI